MGDTEKRYIMLQAATIAQCLAEKLTHHDAEDALASFDRIFDGVCRQMFAVMEGKSNPVKEAA